MEDGVPHVLLVRAKRNPGNFIFPKGHVEPGETEAETAVRELHEEAGVRGTVLGDAGYCSYVRDGMAYGVRFFLLRYEETLHEGEMGRDPRWFPVERACATLTFADSRDLLRSMKSRMK
ncbi:MAG: NUDIX domain-containing protein [Chitinispirillaceae bacterium]|nr:NUDIX domain-containing protein [Chitinispirillaceae bacterium]